MHASESLPITAGFEQKDLLALIPHMRGFARFLCRDSTLADDLTQDALVNALKGRAGFAPGTNLKGWLFTIVRNQFYGDKRRSWRSVPLDQKLAEETLFATSNPMASLELDDVRSAMLQLCDEQREALVLVAVAGLTYEEAARICGCPVGTLKSRVSRARQTLTAAMADETPIAWTPAPGGAMRAMLAEASRLCSPVAA